MPVTAQSAQELGNRRTCLVQNGSKMFKAASDCCQVRPQNHRNLGNPSPCIRSPGPSADPENCVQWLEDDDPMDPYSNAMPDPWVSQANTPKTGSVDHDCGASNPVDFSCQSVYAVVRSSTPDPSICQEGIEATRHKAAMFTDSIVVCFLLNPRSTNMIPITKVGFFLCFFHLPGQ